MGFRKYNVLVDYEKLKQVITRERYLQDIILYEGIVYPMSPEKKKWYDNLFDKSGYKVKVSFNKITDREISEKKIDIRIAIDMVSLAYEDGYDTAILVSGDGDFVPVIKKLKELNKKIELWAFRYSLANTLKAEFRESEINFIDDFLAKIKI
jgi:uncharacterized LabA/DUF88 family protein